jgi:hypothetical protein
VNSIQNKLDRAIAINFDLQTKLNKIQKPNTLFVLEASLISNCSECNAPMMGHIDSTKDYHLILKCIRCNHSDLYEVINDAFSISFNKIKKND